MSYSAPSAASTNFWIKEVVYSAPSAASASFDFQLKLSPGSVSAGETFGTAIVTFGEWTVIPPSIADGAFGGASLVAYAIRSLTVDAIGPGDIGDARATGVLQFRFDDAVPGHNQPAESTNFDWAWHITPSGLAAGAFGTASVAGGSYTINDAGGFQASQIGGASLVAFAVRYIEAQGFESAAYGGPVAGQFTNFDWNWTGLQENAAGILFDFSTAVSAGEQRISTSGVVGEFGIPRAENLLRDILPAGIAPSGIGGTTVYNLTSYITVPGAESAAVVDIPTVEFLDRSLAPPSIDAAAIGAQVVTNQHRRIDLAGRGPLGTLFGAQFIAYKERFVYPPFVFANAFGVAKMGFRRELVPSGIDQSTFGVADVRDSTQRLEAISAGAGWAVGGAGVTRSPRVVAPTGFDLREIAPSERWGRPNVYNLTQVLPRVAIDPDPENGGVFGHPNNVLVENRNRTIAHYGHLDSRVSGGATLDLTGRALLVAGIDATAFGSTLIAPAIRAYQLDGIETPWFTPYHALHNAAKQVLPAAINQSAFGTPAWSNPPQRISFTGAFDSQAHGTAFVAFAIRSVVTPLGPESFYGSPRVDLGTKYVSPSGLDATRWGATYVEEHFNIAAAHSILPPVMPLEHYVRNVTPQVYPYAYEMTEWGVPTVRWNPWPVAPDGFVGSEYGRQIVRDRRQTVTLHGLGAGAFGMFAQVRNDTPDPPAQKIVAPIGQSFATFGDGVVRRNEIDAGGYVFSVFGSHEVRLIGAIVPSVALPTSQVPPPRVKGPQYVSQNGIAAPDDPDSGFEPTMHDMKHRTIWATFDVTAQATANHPGKWELVDRQYEKPGFEGVRPFFGVPEVSNQFRSIIVPFDEAMGPRVVPEPAVESTIRSVYPAGRLMQRMGYPSLPGEQVLDVDFGGFQDSRTGHPDVMNRDRELLPLGTPAGAIGSSEIQNFHRELYVPSVALGGPGVPRIHPPEPIIPGMGVQTAWGTSLVAFRIRSVYPSGWDDFHIGDEVGEFGKRMRVTKRYPARPSSIPPGAVGVPRVSDGTQVISYATIAAPGKPSAPTIEINNKIALGGLGPHFEAHGETVITHGDGLEFVCGSAARAIPVVGVSQSVIGSHGVAHG